MRPLVACFVISGVFIIASALREVPPAPKDGQAELAGEQPAHLRFPPARPRDNYPRTNNDILKQVNELRPDGSYQWSYETGNGIKAQEEGHPSNLPKSPIIASGSFQYISPDNIPISVVYVADENGFQPRGDHIPTTPPLIARALEWIATHPQSQ